MGISMRHVVWCAATLSLGSFFYVLTLEPMDETQNPRAAALGRETPRSVQVLHIRRSMTMGQLAAAERQSRELLRQHPEDLSAVFYRAQVMDELGHTGDARSNWALLGLLTRGLESWENRYTQEEVEYFRAWSLIGRGHTDAGQRVFARLADDLATRSRNGDDLIASSDVHYDLACFYSMAGQLEAAMSHWERAIELGDLGNHIEQGWWAVEPDLKPLHEAEHFWEIGSMGMGHGVGRSRGAGEADEG